MSGDVHSPTVRYNTDITREHYSLYTGEKPYMPDLFAHGVGKIIQDFNPLRRPDSDMGYKIAACTVYSAFPAYVTSVRGVINNYKRPVNYSLHGIGDFLAGIGGRCAIHSAPFLMAGATYGVTLSVITKLRKKESPANHMIAAYASGATYAAVANQHRMVGVLGGAILAIVTGTMKYFWDHDMLTYKVIHINREFNHYRRGYLTERPNAEGRDDADKDVDFKDYLP